MSGHALHPTEFVASGKALEVRGLIVVPVHVRGEMHGLSATPSCWRGLIDQLAAIGITSSGCPPTLPAAPAYKGARPRSAKHSRYEVLYDEYCARNVPVRVLAEREGLNLFTLWSAFSRIKAERRAAARGERQPVEKPGGGIL
jgi:hypothetical protein